MSSQARLKAGDWAVLVSAGVLVGGLGVLLFFTVFRDLRASSVETGLTNVATAGSIVSGLSLTGLVGLGLQGGLLDRLRERYGRHLRAWFMGTFAIVTISVIACATLSAVPATLGARIALSGTPGLILVVLLVTAAAVTSLYGMEGKPVEITAKVAPASPGGPAGR